MNERPCRILIPAIDPHTVRGVLVCFSSREGVILVTRSPCLPGQYWGNFFDPGIPVRSRDS